jgi:hypothetical protein
MRRTTMVFVAAVTLVVGGLGGRPAAQETKSARGSVTALGADSITVKAGTQELVLAVDTKTVLTASGAGTASAKTGGMAFTAAVGVGDQVSVSYRKMGDALHAESVRVTAKKK